jgi:hypothetical protein
MVGGVGGAGATFLKGIKIICSKKYIEEMLVAGY